jgi:hypothetical protein
MGTVGEFISRAEEMNSANDGLDIMSNPTGFGTMSQNESQHTSMSPMLQQNSNSKFTVDRRAALEDLYFDLNSGLCFYRYYDLEVVVLEDRMKSLLQTWNLAFIRKQDQRYVAALDS